MKSSLASRVFICASLLLTFVYLLLFPSISIAATGSASCAGDTTVTCNAYRCDCQDNVGCTGYDANGNIMSSQTHMCSSDLFLL